MTRLLALVALSLLALCAPAAAGARDAVPAKWAKAHHLGKAAAGKDLDRDGLGTWAEWRSRTNPRRADSDGDRRPDGAEDRDRDGLANGFEEEARTDPGAVDTDRDRRRDGREDADRDGLDHAAEARYGYAPRRADSDGDGVRDGDEHAGVIRSVDGARVTIALARGGLLVAAIDEDTELACRAADDPGEEVADDPFEEADEPTDEEGEAEPDPFGPDDEASPLRPETDEEAEDLAGAARLGCGAAALRSGALVRAATVTRGPDGPLLSEVELLLRD